MSGIIGKLSFDPEEPLVRAVLERMLDACVERAHLASAGQSTKAVYDAPGIALGWCGAQDARAPGAPFGVNERLTVRVVADSMLTNAADVRAQLEARSHRFRGPSDSELIAHAYEEWGPRCVERLRGPFACAVWDEDARHLMLARDHIGIRPLYFALLPGHGVVFASEIRALLHDPGVGRQWCPDAIDAYLALGYVPAPLTAYRRVSKLEPAHLFLAEGRRLRVEQYWDLPTATTSVALDDRLGALDGYLRAAIGRDRNEERAGGILYSGSTASSVLLAAATRTAGPAVTVGIEQDGSELARSYAAARHLGHARELEVVAPDAPLLADEFTAHCDEPIADPSAIVQFAVCRAARRHVDRASTAHGASVLWAGYARHRVERVELAVRTWLGGPFATMSAQLARSFRGSVKGARALSHLALPPAGACAVKHAYGLWDDEHRRNIYTRDFAWQVRDANPFSRHLELYAAHESGDALERALYVDTRTFLPDSALASADRAALAAGLHLDFPFLDREIVALAAATPSSLKQRGSTGMHPLRRLLLRQLPRTLMPPARPQPPRHMWLRAALAAMVPAMLLATRFDCRGIVSRPALRKLWEEHRSGRHDHSHRLWSLLMLEFWFRELIDGDAAAEPLEYAVLKVAA